MEKSFTNEPVWNYYGAFLNQASRNWLLDFVKTQVNIPADWKVYCDHMTIVYNDGSENAEIWADSTKGSVGENVKLLITHIGVSDRAIAVKVAGVSSNNKNPHITIAVAPGAKPVESNQITEWTPTNGMMYASAKIDVVWRKVR